MDKECDLCGKIPATVHLTEVINEKVSKMHLCEECAKKKSHNMQAHFGLTDLLSGLMDFGDSALKEESADAVGVACPVCGMEYADFQKTGRLGCGRCYSTYEDRLSVLLRKIHGSDRHVGKMPYKGDSWIKDQKRLKHLKDELERSIRSENFERSAILRDEIKELESKLEKEG